ncbi:MAG: AAA family ATPase [Candidatus Zixiibacteriota bacterium]
MTTSIDAIINRQLLKWELEKKKAEEEKRPRPTPMRILTVSRQLGSRGSYFAERLAERLGYQILHREVIEVICRSSGYRKRIVESLDEKFRGDLELMVESVFTGQSVDHHDYYRHLFQIVLSMSQLGGVVLCGRGGNFILGPNRGFHLRFIAPKQKRLENLVRYKKVTESEALTMIDKSDTERKELIAKLFHANIDDPRHYDLVINTAFVNLDDLLDVVIHVAEAKFQKLVATTTECE